MSRHGEMGPRRWGLTTLDTAWSWGNVLGSRAACSWHLCQRLFGLQEEVSHFCQGHTELV